MNCFCAVSRPYRGQPPTVAGFLMYPDTPSIMNTTSREAFCFKGDHIIQSKHPSSSREAPKENSSRGRRSKKNEYGGNCGHPVLPGGSNEETTEMKSQYERDFPRPSSHWTRQTPACPQPDNLGINPAFRIEFSTVQKESYPSWLIMKPRDADKQKLASSRQDL